MNQARLELQSIQSMLAAGHRSVHLERHSLLLMGGIGGFLTGFTESVITAQRFPDVKQRAVALLVWLSVWLGAMSVADHWLTRRARAHREETLPFAQGQITRAWWMLLAMGTLGTFAMSFYGGGAMVYALWIVLVGMGIYLFGLFSRTLIEWIGVAAILLGVTGLAAGLCYDALRWLAASCFAIGMPLAGWLDARCGDAPWPRRAVALAVWIALVAGLPLGLARQFPVVAPTAAPTLLADAGMAARGERVVRLAAGTPVALRLDMAGPLLKLLPNDGLTMALSEPIDIVLQDGTPDGRFRVGDGEWRTIRDRSMVLRIDPLRAQIEHGEPVVRAHAVFGAPPQTGAAP
jgi:hypothetical protein